MANNIAVTEGSGKSVASEDVGGVQFGLVKMVDASAGSSTRTGVAANPFQVSLANHAANAVPVNVALTAAAALIGQVSASQETGTVYNGTTALTPKFAAIAASSSGNNTIVAAVTSKKIRVLGLKLIANGTVNAKWQSGASGTDLTGLSYLVVNSGEVLPFSPVGWFESASGVLLNLNLSGAVAVGGHLIYVEV